MPAVSCPKCCRAISPASRPLARGKLRLAAFSRNQELQADVIGVRMLGEAGYDPYAAARFLDSMGGL